MLLYFSDLFFNIFQTISVGRRKFSANLQLVFRLIKGLIFLTFVATLVILMTLLHMTPKDMVVCVLAFLPTGWGMLLVSHHPFYVLLNVFSCPALDIKISYLVVI